MLGGSNEPALKRLNSELGPDVRLKFADKASDLEPELADAKVLFQWAGNREELKRVLAGAPRLAWIHGRYAGLDAILSPELIESPVPLTNGRGSFSQSLGEFVMCGALYLLPRIYRACCGRRRSGSVDVFDVMPNWSTQTMGIVGHGDIGRAIARLMRRLSG